MPQITVEELQTKLLDLKQQRLEHVRQAYALAGSIAIVEQMIAQLESKEK